MERIEELIGRLCDDYLDQIVAADRRDRALDAKKRGSGLGYVLGRSPEEILTVSEEAQLHWDLAIEDIQEAMETGDRSAVREDAQELLKRAGVDLQGEDLERLLYELQRTLIRAGRICQNERRGDFSGEPRPDEGLTPSRGAAAGAAATGEGSRTVSELIQEYLKEAGARKWAPRTVAKIRRALEVFEVIVGGATPLASIRPEMIRRYRDVLVELPPRASTQQIEALVGSARPRAKGERLASKTANQHIEHISTMFKFAIKLGWLDRNPASGWQVKEEDAGQKNRSPFTDEDLKAIFGSSYVTETLGRGKAARYWIPLLGAFTGARIEELASLRVEDVETIDGVDVLHIRPSEAKGLKTPQSKRIIPIHPMLKKLGFLDYAEDMRRKKAVMIFPDEKKGRNGYSGAVGKWFGRYQRTAGGITDEKKVFHSFRHTVAERLKHVGVSLDTRNELLGHKSDKIGEHYAGRLSVKQLAEALSKLDYGAVFEALPRWGA